MNKNEGRKRLSLENRRGTAMNLNLQEYTEGQVADAAWFQLLANGVMRSPHFTLPSFSFGIPYLLPLSICHCCVTVWCFWNASVCFKIPSSFAPLFLFHAVLKTPQVSWKRITSAMKLFYLTRGKTSISSLESFFPSCITFLDIVYINIYFIFFKKMR